MATACRKAGLICEYECAEEEIRVRDDDSSYCIVDPREEEEVVESEIRCFVAMTRQREKDRGPEVGSGGRRVKLMAMRR